MRAKFCRFTATPNNRQPITLITVNDTKSTLDTANAPVNDICTDRIEFNEECVANLYSSGALTFNELLVGLIEAKKNNSSLSDAQHRHVAAIRFDFSGVYCAQCTTGM